MLDLEFINDVRKNSKTAREEAKRDYNNTLSVYSKQESFQKILHKIKEESLLGATAIDLIEEGFGVDTFTIECLTQMGFDTPYISYSGGNCQSLIVSWENVKTADNLVYIVQETTGSYDDIYTHIVRVCKTYESAEKYVEEQKEIWNQKEEQALKCSQCGLSTVNFSEIKDRELFSKKWIEKCPNFKFTSTRPYEYFAFCSAYEACANYETVWDDDIPIFDIREFEVED